MSLLGQALIHRAGVLTRRGDGDTDIHTGEDDMKTQGREGHPQVKERGLRRNQPCGHLDLRLQTYKRMRKFSVI